MHAVALRKKEAEKAKVGLRAKGNELFFLVWLYTLQYVFSVCV